MVQRTISSGERPRKEFGTLPLPNSPVSVRLADRQPHRGMGEEIHDQAAL